MIIKIATGIGQGPTKLSAFDSALNKTGIADRNIIRLSSVIPPDTKLKSVKTIKNLPGQWGDRLYVVMAEQRVDRPNIEAWAGIGWVQDPKNGQGLFVEHEGHSEQTVRNDIKQSLKALMETRGIRNQKITMKVTGTTCKDHAVCAMVVAVYQASDWDNGAIQF